MAAVRHFGKILTATVNRKGVLDVDVVKGCSAGVAVHGENGCYGSCYAAATAKYLGIDFSVSTVRTTTSRRDAEQVERAVRASKYGFFRIGTMGDPSHSWTATVDTVEWLAPYAVPVIVTKHWRRLSDEQLNRLIECGAVLNTSVSALDDSKRLWHRISEIKRYEHAGGTSVARVVSCWFNTADPVGLELDRTQKMLLQMKPSIDNPLRCSRAHPLVKSGVIRVRKVRDMQTIRSVSIAPGSTTHLGFCRGCEELCGVGFLTEPDVRPIAPQLELFKNRKR